MGLGVLGAPVTWVFGIACTGVGIWIGMVLVEPARDIRSVVRRIAVALVFHANVHANPGDLPPDKMDETQKVYRALSSELRAAASSVPQWARGPLAALKIIPAWGDIAWSAKNLLALSNMIHGGSPLPDLPMRNWDLADQIRSRLGIERID